MGLILFTIVLHTKVYIITCQHYILLKFLFIKNKLSYFIFSKKCKGTYSSSSQISPRVRFLKTKLLIFAHTADNHKFYGL